ncbi:5'-3' exonuclease [Mycoplasma iguanae]|uniref:5'-3' exonuclease n=1 Tax=Mycoplasma iguanae TaxID=292461 RepID=A0ABY5RAZ3_9MOLU|nr:5'-3' exonuclease [Mycoplasma iguanae]UVD81939.1 5'-3' exonuclease [Mycoplasma iguanae]
MEKNRILLIDGTYLMFKSYYSNFNSNFINKTDNQLQTNGIHVFFTSFFSLIKNFDFTHCFIAFDHGSKTKRHDTYQDYKAGRIKQPDDLFTQMNHVREIISLMQLQSLSIDTIEADDLIASLTEKLKINQNNEIYIFSGDHDLLQLIDRNVNVIYTKKGTSGYLTKNLDNFYILHNLNPSQIIEYKGLAGDSSDNLPGIAGIGEKTAKSLLNKYGTIDNIYLNLDKLTPKTQEKFLKNKQNAYMCRNLAILDRHIDLNINLNEMKLQLQMNEKLKEKLESLFLKRLALLIEKG